MVGQRPRSASPYRYGFTTHQHYLLLSHFVLSDRRTEQLILPLRSLRLQKKKQQLVGNYQTAAFPLKFTMKTATLLLLVVAICSRGLAQVEDRAAEELQVETLVSNNTLLHFVTPSCFYCSNTKPHLL